MIKKNQKAVLVAATSIVLDLTRNVREATETNYDLEPLINDLQMRGQQDVVTLEKVGDKLYPLKGFRRASAFAKAVERNLVYGESAPEAGKPMDKILAIVYEGLDEKERTELLLDHGQRKGLNRVELQNAFERAFVSGYTDKEIVTLLYGLLEQLYPPTRKVEEDPNTGAKLVGEKLAQAKFEYYKGVLQTAKRANRAPTVLREAYYKKLRGEQNWPTNSELADLLGIHDREAEANAMISRQKPGPKFLEKWNALVDAKKEANGSTRPKASSMRNRQQVEESLKLLESPILKAAQKIQLGDIPVDRLMVLDKICQKVWDNVSAEDQATITGWFTAPAPEVPAPTDAGLTNPASPTNPDPMTEGQK